MLLAPPDCQTVADPAMRCALRCPLMTWVILKSAIDPYYNFVFTSMFTSIFDQSERVVPNVNKLDMFFQSYQMFYGISFKVSKDLYIIK